MNELVGTKERDWARLSKEWERSGLSQKKFCKKHGVSYTSFCQRRSELRHGKRQQTHLRSVREKKMGQFIPVTVEAEEPAVETRVNVGSFAPEVEVELPFGVILRFRGMPRR